MNCLTFRKWVLTVSAVLMLIVVSSGVGIHKFDFSWKNAGDENFASLKTTGYLPILSEFRMFIMAGGAILCFQSFLACVLAWCKCWRLLLVYAVFFLLTSGFVLVFIWMSVKHQFSVLGDELKSAARSWMVKDPNAGFMRFLSVLSVKVLCCEPGDLHADWQIDPDKVMTPCCKTVLNMFTVCERDGLQSYNETCYKPIVAKVGENYLQQCLRSPTTVICFQALSIWGFQIGIAIGLSIQLRREQLESE